MIPKLKRKFILINMSLVSLVLIIVFISIGLFSYERVKGESIIAMEKIIDRHESEQPHIMEIGGKKPEMRGPLVPAFSVLLNESNKIQVISKENVTVTDSVVSEITKEVLASDKKMGTLWQYELRYMIRETPEGTKIGFADMNREIETMLSLLITMILVGFCALAAFLLISIYLARWTLKPVALAWEQQKQFVADASHELKTPLTVILANTGILLSHKQDTIEAQSKWIEYTQTEANRMKKLVDDLLFLAKADAAHKPLIQSTVNLSDVLWHCILPFESVAYENGVRIDTNIESDLCFMGNEGQLQQLAVILIDNACKYAGHSGLVTVSLVRQHDELILKINNTGAIIPTDHLNHIFDRFYRVDTARTREQGGYGLGLAIAHTIVDTHKGNIRVTSNEIDGTTFEVRFK